MWHQHSYFDYRILRQKQVHGRPVTDRGGPWQGLKPSTVGSGSWALPGGAELTLPKGIPLLLGVGRCSQGYILWMVRSHSATGSPLDDMQALTQVRGARWFPGNVSTPVAGSTRSAFSQCGVSPFTAGFPFCTWMFCFPIAKIANVNISFLQGLLYSFLCIYIIF